MEILNIGPLELIIILVLMFILLGPKEMILTAQRIGRWIRQLVRSPMWREIMGYSEEIRELPKKIMDESGLQETLAEIQQNTQAAANELTAQINEAKEAARVPEAEHLRIDPNAIPAENTSISKPRETTPVPAELTPDLEPAQEPAQAPGGMLVGIPAMLQVAESASSVDSVPPAGDPALVPDVEPEAAPPSEPVQKKPRRKKVQAQAESAAPVDESAGVDTAANLDATQTVDTSAYIDATQTLDVGSASEMPSEEKPAAPKRPRTRKPKPAPVEPSEPAAEPEMPQAAVEVAPAETVSTEDIRVEDIPSAPLNGNGVAHQNAAHENAAQENMEAASVPVAEVEPPAPVRRTRKPRAPKVAAQKVEESAVHIEPAVPVEPADSGNGAAVYPADSTSYEPQSEEQTQNNDAA